MHRPPRKSLVQIYKEYGTPLTRLLLELVSDAVVSETVVSGDVDVLLPFSVETSEVLVSLLKLVEDWLVS